MNPSGFVKSANVIVGDAKIIVMEVGPLSRFLTTYSILWMDLIRLMLISLPIIIIMEFYKYIKRKKLAKC